MRDSCVFTIYYFTQFCLYLTISETYNTVFTCNSVWTKILSSLFVSEKSLTIYKCHDHKQHIFCSYIYKDPAHWHKDKSFLWFKSCNGITKHIPFTFPIQKNPSIFMLLEACLNLGFLCYALTETRISWEHPVNCSLQSTKSRVISTSHELIKQII